MLTVLTELGLEKEKWVASHQDRASTNVLALRLLKEGNDKSCIGVNPARNDCMAHSLSNAGKEATKGSYDNNGKKESNLHNVQKISAKLIIAQSSTVCTACAQTINCTIG